MGLLFYAIGEGSLFRFFGYIDILLGTIGVTFCFIRFKLKPKITNYKVFDIIVSLSPMVFLIAEDILMIGLIPNNPIPTIFYSLILFSFVAIYDVPYYIMWVILVISSVVESIVSKSYLEINGVISSVAIPIVIGFVSYIVDNYSCNLLEKEIELKYKNKNMRKAIESAIEEVNEFNERITQMQNETVLGLANLIETRSGETGGHVKRTSTIVHFISNKAMQKGIYTEELTQEYAEMVTKAAVLHDIGKIKVPDAILNAPRSLTAEEFDTIKKHTTDGEEILMNILKNIEDDRYLAFAIQIAGSHHEKWDGSGYPGGLQENEIPLCARIMAIADVYDALISERCYKQSMSPSEAIDEIEKGIGTHFDPLLARVFVDEMRLLIKEPKKRAN